MTDQLHVLFGAGQVGSLLARALTERGCRVRVVKRTPVALPPGVELLRGDAGDRAFCVTAATGAAVVYHCMNPPYDRAQWTRLVPLYMTNLIAAAAAAGSRLVVLDNLYMLGRTAGRPMTGDTPMRPCSRKGEIRARAAEALFEAHRSGRVQAVTGRASDYYGPGGTLTHFGDGFWKPALAGRTARTVVNLDVPHTYHYIPDVVAGLAALGLGPESVSGRTWMLPCAAAETTRHVAGRFARALGREIRVATLPRPLVRALGLVVPLLREVNEMLYQWDEPFIVDDAAMRRELGVTPTDPDRAARDTVAWAVEHYGTDGGRPA
jgi:nucleoside-diphosphate-sugar epimerase